MDPLSSCCPRSRWSSLRRTIRGKQDRLYGTAGLNEAETAEAMGISSAVQMEWRVARAWLHRELSKGDTRA